MIPSTPASVLEGAASETDEPASTAAETGAGDGGGDGGEEPADTAAPEPEAVLQEPVKAAVDIKEAVASESRTVGGIIETLDSYAVTVGSTHVSLWSALTVVLILVAVVVVARLGSKLAQWLLSRVKRFDSTQKLLSEKLASIVVWVLAVLIGVDILGIDLTALAFFSGAFGLAIGFGLQKTFGNLIAGIILLMDRSIKPGDVITVTDAAGNETFGQIRKIGIRAVSLVTRDRKEYLIPNENLMVNQVENWSYSSREVRVQVPVGVSYNADIGKAVELMLEAARASKRVLNNPEPTVWFDAYGDSSVNFIIHCWINDPEQGVGNVKSQVLTKLWWLLKENEIEIPFPQRDINLRDNAAFRDLLKALQDGKVKVADTGDSQVG
jgi:small-conductance mechanosensitive channel